MNVEDLQSVDSKKMYQVYDSWPQISKESFDNNFKEFDVKNIDHIVFVGMGSSGSIGDVISSILSKEDIHVSNVKGYHLPNNLFFQEISMIHSPRASFTKFLFSILKTLQEIIPINEADVKESISVLNKTRNNIFSSNLEEDNVSLRLASWIKTIPLIYYPWGLQSAAIRFKNSLQENSKIHVIAEDVIESCHNGIVGWEKESMIQPILIRGQDDYIKTIERWNILKEFFSEKGIQYYEIKSESGNILSKIVNLIYLLDYTSIYHAILHKTDPSPVDSIDFIKSRV